MKTWEEFEKSNKRKSGFITTGIIAMVAFIMFLFGFTPPDPPLEAEGLLIDFGTSTTGSGSFEPDTKASAPSKSSEQIKEEVATQDVVESVKLPDTKKNETPKNSTTTTTETKPTINEKELFDPGKISNKGQTGSSEGSSTYGGNQGSTNGDPNGYQGPGQGKGDDGKTGWDLSGRSASYKAPLAVQHNEIGDVRIKIYVDRNGKVTKAEYERVGSTVTDSYLINKSKEAALKWSFNADKNAPETQIGYITFHFKLQ
jgi:outer membrane biosynthesis protein TonB